MENMSSENVGACAACKYSYCLYILRIVHIGQVIYTICVWFRFPYLHIICIVRHLLAAAAGRQTCCVCLEATCGELLDMDCCFPPRATTRPGKKAARCVNVLHFLTYFSSYVVFPYFAYFLKDQRSVIFFAILSFIIFVILILRSFV